MQNIYLFKTTIWKSLLDGGTKPIGRCGVYKTVNITHSLRIAEPQGQTNLNARMSGEHNNNG